LIDQQTLNRTKKKYENGLLQNLNKLVNYW